MQITAAILEKQPFLKGMTQRQLEILATDAIPAEFKTDELILNQGAPANRFFLILEGQVKIECPVFTGEKIDIETLGKGDVLGWSWLFAPYLWHFDARAVAPTKTIFFYADDIREPRYVVQLLRLLLYTPGAADISSVLQLCESTPFIDTIAKADLPLVHEIKQLRKQNKNNQ